MNSYQKIIAAFAIFDKYSSQHSDEVSAEHDIIYAGPSDSIMEADDIEALYELGWDFKEDYDCWYKFV